MTHLLDDPMIQSVVNSDSATAMYGRVHRRSKDPIATTNDVRRVIALMLTEHALDTPDDSPMLTIADVAPIVARLIRAEHALFPFVKYCERCVEYHPIATPCVPVDAEHAAGRATNVVPIRALNDNGRVA